MTTAQIAESSEFLTEEIVSRFEQLGRKQIVPNLLVADYPAARHMVRLSYSEQKRILHESVELMVLDNGNPTTLRVSPENLTPQQCRQVFERGHVRSIGAQRAWLQERRVEDEIQGTLKQGQDTYKIRGKRVVILRPCEFTSRQLANMIAEIEA